MQHHPPQVQGIATRRRRPVGGAPSPAAQHHVAPREDAVDDLLDDYFAIPVARPASRSTDKHLLQPHHHAAPPLRVDTRARSQERRWAPPRVVDSPDRLTPPTPALSALPPLSPALSPGTPTYLTAVTPDAPNAPNAAPDAAAAASLLSLAKPFWKTAIDETVYFAGGLISHPAESTRHYTVLRHSPGLVYYRGPSTSVAITIFSDTDDNDDDGGGSGSGSGGATLPPGRTLWLQRKGFSGNMGMDASAFFRTDSSWIDVTPSARVSPADVPAADERAWQRDIAKFLKKAAGHKRLSKHRACETCVVRVPAAAADGYMRIVVCSGGSGKKKSLCPSPVFRVASTSRDMSVLRGASMTTLPLELGIRAANAIGEKYLAAATGPAAVAVQAGVKRLEHVTRNPRVQVAMAAMRSGAAESAATVEERHAPIRQAAWDSLHETDSTDAPPETVGDDTGPEDPFPVHMSGRAVWGTGQSRLHTGGFPTANLSGVPGELLMRLGGIYMGWAALPRQTRHDGPRHDWHKAVITIGPALDGAARVAAKNTAAVHLVQDSGGGPIPPLPDDYFDNTRMDVVIMAFLRPLLPRDPPPPPAHAAAVLRESTALATASLDRDAWHHRHQQHLVEDGGAVGGRMNPLVRALKTHKSFSDFAASAGRACSGERTARRCTGPGCGRAAARASAAIGLSGRAGFMSDVAEMVCGMEWGHVRGH
ncbi:Riboflavin kinase [Microdochium nivale]|nr:Riboflavin kinase [Microdochium nivale]